MDRALVLWTSASQGTTTDTGFERIEAQLGQLTQALAQLTQGFVQIAANNALLQELLIRPLNDPNAQGGIARSPRPANPAVDSKILTAFLLSFAGSDSLYCTGEARMERTQQIFIGCATAMARR
jgi:hypothetical protein